MSRKVQKCEACARETEGGGECVAEFRHRRDERRQQPDHTDKNREAPKERAQHGNQDHELAVFEDDFDNERAK